MISWMNIAAAAMTQMFQLLAGTSSDRLSEAVVAAGSSAVGMDRGPPIRVEGDPRRWY